MRGRRNEPTAIRRWVRAWAALAVLLGSLGLGARGARSQEVGTETLTIYGAVCPAGYAGEAFFEDCYETPAAGAAYVVEAEDREGRLPVEGDGAVADGDGFVAFEDLAVLGPGPVTVRADLDPPGATIGRARCTAQDGRDVPVTLPAETVEAFGTAVSFQVAPGDDLRCDLYFVPPPGADGGDAPTPTEDAIPTEAPASPTGEAEPADSGQGDLAALTIQRRVCPPGFVGPDLRAGCGDPVEDAGVELSLGGAETRLALTDETGAVAFADLTPGAYFVGDDRPGGDFTRRVVRCSPEGADGVPFPAGLGTILLAAGDAVVCEWYITNPGMSNPDPSATPAPTPTSPPALPEGTTLTIASWACPEDLTSPDYAAACEQTPGAGFGFRGVAGQLDEVRADDEGIVRFDLAGLPQGGVTIATSGSADDPWSTAGVVGCEVGGRALPVSPSDNLSTYSMVSVQVAPGDEVRCAWYHVPVPRG